MTSVRETTTAAQDWAKIHTHVDFYQERLQGVILENKDAFSLIQSSDSEKALFYIDPPYLHETRHQGSEKCYQYELDVSEHEKLLRMVNKVKAKVIISGYTHDLYNDYLANKSWKKVTKSSLTDSINKRDEILWIKSNENVYSLGALQTAR